MLRCKPFCNSYQKIIRHQTSVIPNCKTTESKDAFGNVLLTGYVEDSHDVFMFESAGIVETSRDRTPELLNPLYCYPSTLTEPDDAIKDAVAAVGAVRNDYREWVEAMSEYLKEHFTYESGTTDVTTSAAMALAQGKGVCQDYAHIAISMCRYAGIAARYANGFMTGEGATHAWIEYYDGITWQSFDPTNNRIVDDTYIKIAHGRDFNDCSINRGRFNGMAEQTIKIKLMVEQLKRLPKE